MARAHRWGNPFRVDEHGRDGALQLHRGWILATPERLHAVWAELAGLDLACWCPPHLPCHADMLLQIANDDELPA